MKKISQLTTGAALIAAGVLSSTHPASAWLIDFEETDDGNILKSGSEGAKQLETAWQNYGLNISATDYSGNKSKPLSLFNSNCGPEFSTTCSDGKTGLATGETNGTQPQGNVLIFAETPDFNLESDNQAQGGIISFKFKTPVLLEKIALLNIDAGEEGYIEAFLENGEKKTQQLGEGVPTSKATGSNSLTEYSYYLNNVMQVNVKMPSQGAVAFLEYSTREVPEPSSMLGILVLGACGTGSLLLRQRQP